jgi:transposase
MGRPAMGSEYVEQAFSVIAIADSVDQLKMAQALVLPLAFGLNIEQCARLLGVSRGWVSQLRGRFIAELEGRAAPARPGGRKHAYLSQEEEVEFLRPYLESAQHGGVLIVPPIQQALASRVGHPVALSSVYRLLHRHGWRKLAPDKRHPQSDAAAQEDWKKNSPTSSTPLAKTRRGKGPSG